MEEKRKALTLDQLYEEKRELRKILGWGTWNFGNPHPRQVEVHNILVRNLREVEEEIEFREFGEVLLY